MTLFQLSPEKRRSESTPAVHKTAADDDGAAATFGLLWRLLVILQRIPESRVSSSL